MSEEVDRLIKLSSIVNNNRFHLNIETNLEDKAEWRLYQFFVNDELYLSYDNRPILDSSVDSLDDLENYLRKHDGIKKGF